MTPPVTRVARLSRVSGASFEYGSRHPESGREPYLRGVCSNWRKGPS